MLEEVLQVASDYDNYTSGEIIRYNGKHKIKNENIAEHSFMVAINIIEICNLLNIGDYTRNKSVTMAVLHDISERYVGDIAYEFKSDRDNKEILNELFDTYENMLYNDIYGDKFGSIYKEMIDKKDIICDRLVKLSDSMAVVQYSTREMALGNSSSEMKNINSAAKERVRYDYNKLMEVL